MSDDLANLGVKLDSSDLDSAAPKFERLAQSADKAEKATSQLENAAARLRGQLQAAGVSAADIDKTLSKMGLSAQDAQNKLQGVATATSAVAAATTAASAQTAAATATQLAKNEAMAVSLGALGSSAVRAAAIQVASQEAVAAAAVESAAVQVAANTNVARSGISTSVAIRESLVLLREASVGNFTRMAGSASILLGALGLLSAVLIPVAAAAIAFGGAVAIAKNQINSGAEGTGDLTRQLGLNEEQIERVKNRYVTFGDTAKAVFQVLFHDLISEDFKSGWQEYWNDVALVVKAAIEYSVGTVLAGVRVIEEAWKVMPKALGGEGTTAAIDFAKAFQSGLDDAKKGLDNFYSDVGNVARQNAANRILKEAGKAPKTVQDGAANQAEKEIQKLNDETAAQTKLNDAVETTTLSVGAATEAQKLYQQTASLVARIEKDDKLSKEEKASLIARLTTAQKGYNEVMKDTVLINELERIGDENQQIQLQTSLIGANTRAQSVALATLKAQEEAFSKNYSASQTQDLISAYVAIANSQVDLANATSAYNDKLHEQADIMDELAQHSQAMASTLEDSFGTAGKAIAGLTNAYTNHASAQAKFAEQEAVLQKQREAGKDTTSAEIVLRQKQTDVDTEYYADVIGASKEFFAQGSAGYKLLQAAETAYRAYSLVMSIAGIAQKSTETAAVVALNSTQTASAATTAVANAAADVPFPFNLGAIATIVAVLAGFGILAGGSGGASAAATPIDPAKDLQAKNGAGSVLGDATAKSDSISKSLDKLTQDSNTDLEYSSQMVTSLKGIQQGIGSLTSLLARQLKVGGLFDTASLGLGSSSSGVGSGIPLLGGIVSSLFGSSSSSTTLLDQGISIAGTTIGQAIASGINANAYQTTKTDTHSSALFGLISSSSSSTKTNNTALSSDFTGTISSIVSGLRSTVLDAASKLGLIGAQDVIDSFSVNLGKISFKDLTGSQIQDALNAVFSELGDELAAAAVPQVAQLQQVGEGALETLSRLVNEYAVVDDAAKTVGFTFSQIGVDSLAARDNLIQVSGGLDNFAKQASFFVSNFESSADALAPIQRAVTDEMSRLGLTSVRTKAQFAAVVQSLDTSTDSGASLYAALQNVAPAFAKVADAIQEVADKRNDLEIKLLQAEGDAIGATALERQKELSALDASLVPLQNLVYAAQDLTDAQTALTTAQKNLAKAQSDAQKAANQTTQQTINTFTNFATSLASFQQQLLVGTLANNNAARQYSLTRSVFNTTASAAARGDQAAIGNLQQVSTDFLTASKAASVTSIQYTRDLASVKSAVTAASVAANNQVTLATQQLFAINDVNDSVLSVAEAVQELADAQSKFNTLQLAFLQAQSGVDFSGLPGHASGLQYVPYNNYAARLHQGERVLNPTEAANYNSGKDMLNELRSMRKELAANTNKTNKLLRRFTSDGDTLNVKVIT